LFNPEQATSLDCWVPEAFWDGGTDFRISFVADIGRGRVLNGGRNFPAPRGLQGLNMLEIYPHMPSPSSQFGDRNRGRLDGAASSLLQSGEAPPLVESQHSFLIHEGLFDDMPKTYELIENGAAI
jgi:hypothetical protein